MRLPSVRTDGCRHIVVRPRVLLERALPELQPRYRQGQAQCERRRESESELWFRFPPVMHKCRKTPPMVIGGVLSFLTERTHPSAEHLADFLKDALEHKIFFEVKNVELS